MLFFFLNSWLYLHVCFFLDVCITSFIFSSYTCLHSASASLSLHTACWFTFVLDLFILRFSLEFFTLHTVYVSLRNLDTLNYEAFVYLVWWRLGSLGNLFNLILENPLLSFFHVFSEFLISISPCLCVFASSKDFQKHLLDGVSWMIWPSTYGFSVENISFVSFYLFYIYCKRYLDLVWVLVFKFMRTHRELYSVLI